MAARRSAAPVGTSSPPSASFDKDTQMPVVPLVEFELPPPYTQAQTAGAGRSSSLPFWDEVLFSDRP